MIEIAIGDKLKTINVHEKLEITNAGLVFRVKLLMDLYIDYHLVEQHFPYNIKEKLYNLYEEFKDEEVLIYEKGTLNECIFVIENEIRKMIFSI